MKERKKNATTGVALKMAAVAVPRSGDCDALIGFLSF
jgi:hypothetical protein